MSDATIALPREEVAAFCRHNHIRRLSLFGSSMRGDSGPKSDVDLLVEFDPGHRLGFAFFALQDELSRIVGRQVDLHTREDLSRYFRDQVVRTAQLVYQREDGLAELGMLLPREAPCTRSQLANEDARR
ncbi:MAG: polymerase subunit beta [Gemmatimonadetes bacterium]|nr:polymerase subunit beta [Gemmatimonadota bacterium]